MKKVLLLLICYSFWSQLSAQKNNTDSLVTLLQSASDTGKVNLLNVLTRSLWYYQLDRANEYNLQALSLANSISFPGGLAEANRCRGVILNFKGDSTSIVYLEKALSIFRKLNDKKGIAATLNNQSSYYHRVGSYAKALEAATESLRLFEELKDTEAIGAVTNVIGNIYNNQSDFTTALDYFLKALAIRQQIGDKPGTAFSLTRVGNMYAKLNQVHKALDYYQQAYQLTQTLSRNQNLIDVTLSIGDLYKKLGNYKEALNYYNISLKASEDFGGKDGTGNLVQNQRLGEVYILQKNYDLALENLQKAVDIAYQTNQSKAAAILYLISKVYYEKGDYPKALEYASQGLGAAQKNKQYAAMKDASFQLSQIYAAMNDYSKAYQYQLQYDAAKDSVLNEDLNMRLASLQQSFEIKNRQTLIDLQSRDIQLKESELNRQKQQRYAYIVGILLFLVLVIVLARNNWQKQKTNRLLGNTLSNLKATQTQLIQSEKMASLGELTAGIAHEIQNPLNFVNNFSEVNRELIEEMKSELKSGNNSGAISIANDISENEEKINHHGKRADAIVKGMLQHSRTSNGQKEMTDINALCDEYLRLAFHGMRAKDKAFNAKFETDFDITIEKINIVPQEIGRVILNLINNAFYAVSEKNKQQIAGYEPTVAVITRKIKGMVEISVKDNGNGIPATIKDKIFQPFFTTKPTGQGTGLGLSLSYDIVKAHGGEIKVNTKEARPDDTVGRGEGSEFIFQLPVV
ncbi:MAG TPA: tetratricopeptide repeat protein [Chitinophagaceae bacterium]|nr:tetratricopeptide repeat protein [Chitinophagaceae bacterium]